MNNTLVKEKLQQWSRSENLSKVTASTSSGSILASQVPDFLFCHQTDELIFFLPFGNKFFDVTGAN